MDNSIVQNVVETFDYLNDRIPTPLKSPDIAVICGSGLGGLANVVQSHSQSQWEISYTQIPHFPQSQVKGHAGKLLFGLLQSHEKSIVLMLGRPHYYEGHSIEDVTFPIRLLRRLGVTTIIVTNAAGGLNPDYAVGDLVVLNDHINLAGLCGIHPLRGPQSDELGVRFPALSDAYDLALRQRAHKLWKHVQCTSKERRLHEGVYAYAGGPSYETRAECRLLRSLGADLVGMSTVPEIIVARHCNMRVLALSLVTNRAILDPGPRGDDVKIEGSSQELVQVMQHGKATHAEVLDAGKEAALDVQQLMLLIIESLMNTR